MSAWHALAFPEIPEIHDLKPLSPTPLDETVSGTDLPKLVFDAKESHDEFSFGALGRETVLSGRVVYLPGGQEIHEHRLGDNASIGGTVGEHPLRVCDSARVARVRYLERCFSI